tara:strand:- start:412445 stop:413356 length:912 start_codon:yes stop_codon:yes gene_type:complete
MVFLVIVTVGCEEVLYQTDISSQQVTLLAPTDGTNLEFTSVSFNWNSVDDATSYRFQVASPSFANANQILEDILIDSLTQHTLQLNENAYQWRVKALNSGYETQYSMASFAVVSNDNFSDNIVSLIAPDNNVITNQTTFILSWDAIIGATNYRVQIIDNSDQSVIEEVSVTQSQYEFTFPEGDFTWGVRAEKDSEFTLYNTRNILVDTTPPNIPTLVSPADGATLNSGEVTFTWNRELISGSIEFDSIYIYQDQNLNTLAQKQQVSESYSTTLSNDVYYWFMKAFDEASNESGQSEVFSFTIN